MGVRFRVLGDIEVVVDGRRLDIGHARQQCVLVSLLVDVNRAVAPETLIARVWADEPPLKSRNALAAYVSRLRTLLAGIEGVGLVREPGGYALHAPEDSVDLHAARRLIAAARAAATPAEAAARYDEALQLWRGDPLSTVDTPWLNELRTSLAVEHLSASLDRNDVALAIGKHTELLAVLQDGARAHPLDERIAGQLMLAQYRCGRQADALETYRALRQRLVDELGVDPGPALEAVHQRVLDGEPSFAMVRAAVPTPSLRSGAAALPRRASRLIGRDGDVARVTTALEEGPVVTLTGVGGVGKTRLALEVAYRYEEAGQSTWSCELAPLSDGTDVARAIAVALQLPLLQTTAIDDAVVDFLRDRDGLLVVDNCEHVLADAAVVVDRIARHCPRIKTLATSREALNVEGERIVPVSPLPDVDAAALFVERARASRPDFDPEREPVGAVAEICRRLDGVPLAIELAAARMRAMSSLDVARRLDRLRLLSGGARGAHPRQHSVTATIDWSYRLLSEPEQRLFSRISVFAGGFDIEAAHAVCGDPDTTEDDTLDVLTALIDKSMVVVRSGVVPTRYDALETLRSYGRERLQENGFGKSLNRRHATYYAELVERVECGMHGPDEEEWARRFTPNASKTYAAPDFENVRSAFEWLMSAGEVGYALRLTSSMIDLMNRIGYHAASWVNRVVEVAPPDHPLYPTVVGVAARAAWVCGDFEQARAFAARAAGRTVAVGTCSLAYPDDIPADAALQEGSAATTLAHYEAELAADRTSTDPLRFILVVDKLTWSRQALGTPAAGIPLAQRAVAMADEMGNPTARALARTALGRALSEFDSDRALAVLGEAAEIAGTVDNNWLLGISWMEIAAIRGVHGDPSAAAQRLIVVIDHWERGAPGILTQQWDALRHAARLLLRLGARAEAAALHQACVAAGVEPPLSRTQVIELDGVVVPLPAERELVDFARTALRRYCSPDGVDVL